MRLSFSHVSFGILPAQKARAVVALRKEDFQKELVQGRLVPTDNFMRRLMKTYQANGGLVILENMGSAFQAPGDRYNTLAQKCRQAALGIAEAFQKRRQEVTSRRDKGSAVLELKVAFDQDRRAENLDPLNYPNSPHIHHAHFDPPYYDVVGLLDGPYWQVATREADRWVADAQEIRKNHPQGKLPHKLGVEPRYMTPGEMAQFGIPVESHGGSLVFHQRRRFLHWTGASPSRRYPDISRTPYGFFGYWWDPPSSSPWYQTAEELEGPKQTFLEGQDTPSWNRQHLAPPPDDDVYGQI